MLMRPHGARIERSRDERGQAAVLIVGFFLITLLLVVVVVDSSAAYLRRQRLDSLADGAALAAADGVQGSQVYEGGLGERAQIDPYVARGYVLDYLTALGAHRDYPGLQVRVRTTLDSVEVRVTTPLELPFAPPGWAETSTVSGTAASYVAVLD